MGVITCKQLQPPRRLNRTQALQRYFRIQPLLNGLNRANQLHTNRQMCALLRVTCFGSLASGHLLRVTCFGSLASGHLLPRPAWVRMTIATRANPNIHQLSFPSICTHTDTANQACDTCIVPTRSNFIVVRIVGQYLDMQNSPNSGVTAHWQRDPCCAICVPWNSLPLVLALFYVAVGVAEPSHSAACKIPQNRILPTRV